MDRETSKMMNLTGILPILGCLFWINFAYAADLSECTKALGMQSYAIPDDAISASSSYDDASVGPQNGRIHTEKNGGAWCPKNQIDSLRDGVEEEYIEINFRELTVVTEVETQGRFGNGHGQEYTEFYKLNYSSRVPSAHDHWITFHNRTNEEIFVANKNTYSAERRTVFPPIITTKLRIIPYSKHPRTICMRVEVYGCKWTEGVISYTMPQGQRRGAEVDLYDFTYDGRQINDVLSGGLGQLVDGKEGHFNFRLDPQNVGQKGFAWVGWKNDTFNTPPVEMIFEFDKVRNFSRIQIHANNMFSKDVRVFRMAKVFFSVGGKFYTDLPVVYEFMRDDLMEFARPIVIPIKPPKVGRFVKVQLFYDARWIMVSEVSFNSEVVVGNISEEVGDLNSLTTDHPDLRPGYNGGGPISKTIGEDDNQTDSPIPQDNPKEPFNDSFIGIIVGACAAFIILIIVVIIIVSIRQRRLIICSRKNKYKNNDATKSTEHHVMLNLNDLRAMTNGVLSNGNNKYNSIATSDDNDPDSPMDPVNGNVMKVNGDLYPDPYDGIQTRKLPEVPKTPSSTGTTVSREYAVPDMTKSSVIVNGMHKPPPYEPNIRQEESPPPPPLPPHPSALYGNNELLNLQGFMGNSLYAVPNNLELLWKEDLSIMEFPRENIKFMEKLGEGQFGEVHLCEALQLTDFLEDDFLINRTGPPSMLVALKMLRNDADDYARADFHKEVKIMSKLKDPNIVRVIGVVTRDEPLCMLVEYMKYGDLNQFLQDHVPLESTLGRGPNIQSLSYGCLIYMANQIASGMKYLETLNMVHRDLATRNCLVGPNYTIKISDFGMSRSLYSCDYYRIEGKAMLPIRWMAWESVLLGKFSTKSDVWSYAVTLWEILTFAREQPYDNLDDEHVIENCGHYYRNDNQVVWLPQPPNCPKEIYDLMVECWNRDELCRPAFREISMFMLRKNMGYNPRDERQSTLQRINVPVV